MHVGILTVGDNEDIMTANTSFSLAQVYLLYEGGKYDEVIDRLKPILNQESGSYNDVGGANTSS